MTRCNKARQELYTLMASQTVVDITRSKGGASNSGPSIRELNLRKLKEAELRREVESLQTEMLRLLTSRRPGYKAESAFGTFASRELAKTLDNKVTNSLLSEATLSSASLNMAFKSVFVTYGQWSASPQISFRDLWSMVSISSFS